MPCMVKVRNHNFIYNRVCELKCEKLLTLPFAGIESFRYEKQNIRENPFPQKEKSLKLLQFQAFPLKQEERFKFRLSVCFFAGLSNICACIAKTINGCFITLKPFLSTHLSK